MLASHDGDESLVILVALGDAERDERLAASLTGSDGIVALTAEAMDSGDHATVVVIDDIAVLENLLPGMSVVLLSGRDDRSVPPDGVAAVLDAEADPALIAAAARLAAAGYRISGATVDAADHSLGEAAPDADESEARLPVHLSPRETEVLALLAEGAPNKAIARRLGISVHTVKFHIAAILVKLGAANRTDAIATAMRQGLVLA
ncbi:helix-turn-helix transcriptional regulator [Mesorhizobium sp. 8]|uniref:helix-turn-helix transcriptional regulator n=1 Tax=Mesorhizobium sp. 8 TaxID=2584466 RepID=UPI001122BBC1|nr:helix-turn-helix transcriptional regulator [Mesorhizobium sp. 8]QDC01709.1 helix-turn-helix transcriptional regulator [Mesorhizobium sp. 8]